ncbi:hypothetical protein M3Y98_00023400 [Aphelenchoides besseyi]|nr:hypothetical protein M3Y98_00023400 [Aphelenchoides besseyi]KAI6199275.1 hypothetical protein M3Y96_00609600 [Aphelenchoides besseyi]
MKDQDSCTFYSEDAERVNECNPLINGFIDGNSVNRTMSVFPRTTSCARFFAGPRRPLQLRRVIPVLLVLLLCSIAFARWKLRDVNDTQIHSTAHGHERYIGLDLKFCNGIANQMYRYASLYSIGKTIDREPYIDSSLPCTTSILPELAASMPEFYSKLHLIRTPRNLVTRVDFASKSCCKFDNVSKLTNISPKITYLKLNSNLLQSYKFFHEHKSELRKIFDFSLITKEYVRVYSEHLFGNDTNFKFCVHTRLGDFKNHAYLLPSKHSFTNPAIAFVGEELHKTIKNISLVLLGTDKQFIEKIRVPKNMFKRIHMPHDMSRTEELHFASTHCDSFLITASGSTFAFWMAYLMADDAQERVFYNYLASKDKSFGKDIYDYDTFPPQWRRLRRFNNTAIGYEPRWHRDIKDDKDSVLLHRGYKV